MQKELTATWPLQKLDHEYELLCQIGEGSFGSVYKARSRASPDKIFAIKHIPRVTRNEKMCRAVIREISILRQLSAMLKYPHVTRLHTAQLEEAEGRIDVILVLDYVETDLNKFLRHSNEGDFSEAETTKLLYSMLCALQFLHSANIMHRDIKPANFLLDTSTWRVQVCDLGYARTVPIQYQASRQGYQKMAKKRRLSQHVVSRWYRPPELILMEANYTAQVDVWSLGCVFAEVMTCSTEYQRLGFRREKRGLFRGTSCYPLSPVQDAKSDSGYSVPDRDQLNIILALMGQATPRDAEFLTSQASLTYLSSLSANKPEDKIDFNKEYSVSDPRIGHLLQLMLEFNPNNRPSPGVLLKSSLFDSIRQPEMELPAPRSVKVEIDEAGVFDYESQKSLQPMTTLADLLRAEVFRASTK